MAQAETPKLDSGAPFPDFEVDPVNGSSGSAKAALGGRWAVVLFFRGHW